MERDENLQIKKVSVMSVRVSVSVRHVSLSLLCCLPVAAACIKTELVILLAASFSSIYTSMASIYASMASIYASIASIYARMPVM